MKKYILLGVGVLFAATSVASAAYQQQGFNQYKETDGTISFRCEKNCVLLLGEKESNDFITVQSGTHQGGGQRGYGYLIGQQVVAATLLPASSYERSFVDDPIYKQLPAGPKQVVFLVTGPLKADGVQVIMGNRGGTQKLTWTWKRFWKTEYLAPYSINLHYGPYVGGWSWPLFALIMSIIAVVIVYIVRKKMTLSQLIYAIMSTLIVLMVIGGVRLLIDDIKIITRGYNEFVAPVDNKRFFELGDYISVTEKVRQHLDLDNVSARRGKECNIYAKSHMSRPFDAHRASVYLRPCTVVQTGAMADYALFYNVAPTEALSGSVVLSGNNFTLYNLRP